MEIKNSSETNKWIQFGEIVAGYDIPVLNEREVRAGAGVLFFFLYTSLMFILFRENFLLIKYSITLFLADFIIRVFINPKYSPSLILGRIFVTRQTPEYVGAAQKKFAWIIGLVLAAIMFVLMVLYNTYGAISGIICLICLIFLFFESVFGICLGCIFYGWFYKEKAQHCPGEICAARTKQEIQKISGIQILIIFAFAVIIVLTATFFNDYLSSKPMELFEKLRSG